MSLLHPDAQEIEYYRAELRGELFILGHHYQSDEVLRHVDRVGDSLELARAIPESSAKYIVFCGVWFMAETAAILARPGQKVLIPDPSAACVMADMAPGMLVDMVMRKLTDRGRKVIPLTYVNSSADVKTVVGRYGGAVCTSANAAKMMTWARGQGDGVIFLPDMNLGANTANALAIPEEHRHVADVRAGGEKLDLAACDKAELILWPGRCVIHHRFKLGHIREIRERDPDAKIIVHPECLPEVVQASDDAGSTSRIIAYCAAAPKDSVIYIGTEINLVERLAKLYRHEKRILPLFPSLCANMAKVTPRKLATTIQGRDKNGGVTVTEEVRHFAGAAVRRMLEASA